MKNSPALELGFPKIFWNQNLIVRKYNVLSNYKCTRLLIATSLLFSSFICSSQNNYFIQLAMKDTARYNYFLLPEVFYFKHEPPNISPALQVGSFNLISSKSSIRYEWDSANEITKERLKVSASIRKDSIYLLTMMKWLRNGEPIVLDTKKYKLHSLDQVNYSIHHVDNATSAFYNGLTVFNFFSILSKATIKKYRFDSCYIKTASFEGDTTDVELSSSFIKKLECSNTVIGKLHINGYSDTIDLQRCVFVEESDVYFSHKPKLIRLVDCRFASKDNVLDLTRMWGGVDSVKCILEIRGTNVSKLKFRYSEFIIDTSLMSLEEIQSFYNGLKDQYARLGMTHSYQLADIDLIRISNRHRGGIFKLIDWVNFQWWTYGYDKGKVFGNSVFLFLMFLFINLCISLKRLSYYGYSMPAYNEISDKIRAKRTFLNRVWFYFWYTFLYTCMVFWGINLDKKELKYKNIGYLFYIIFQYIIGFVCLAYLATYILSK